LQPQQQNKRLAPTKLPESIDIDPAVMKKK